MKIPVEIDWKIIFLIGFIVAVVLIYVFGATITELEVGPFKVALPTVAPSQNNQQPLPISTPTIQAWARQNLIYQEDFEDGVANDWNAVYGVFEVIEIIEGSKLNRVFFAQEGMIQLVLPTQNNDYAVEVRIMQVSGPKGLGMLYLTRV